MILTQNKQIWCIQDSTNFEGITTENVISQYGLSQIINKPTYILESSSLCIDLIFKTQPNLVGNLVFTLLCIQIVNIRLYLQNLIYKYITHHHTHEKSGTINKQILNLSDEQLLTLIGIVFLNTNVSEKLSICSNTIRMY